MLLHHRFIGESVISGANSLYDIALSEVGSFEELPGIHYVIPPGFESVIDILRENVPPSCLLLQHTVTNIAWNNASISESCSESCMLSRHRFLLARRYALAGTSYDPASVCLSVCHKSVVGQIELVFGI